jgi:hypothetical protein
MSFHPYMEDLAYVFPVEGAREKAITNGQQDQPKVLPAGSRAKVRQIQTQLRGQNCFPIKGVRIPGGAQDLLFVTMYQGREIRYSRPHLEDSLPEHTVQLHIFRHFWAGSDEAHVAPQNIKKLRQFV